MTNERRMQLINELKGMLERIQAKQDKGVKKYCKKAPKDVANRIFLSMQEISSQINLYGFINSLSAEEYESIRQKQSGTLMVDCVLRIIVNEVEFLKENYYYSIVSEFCQFCERRTSGFCTDEVEKIKKSLSPIKLNNYIKNHPEYPKIEKLKEILHDTDIIVDNVDVDCYELYKLLGYKEVLSEYERRLNDITSVNDINLKRAFYTYLDESIEFYHK